MITSSFDFIRQTPSHVYQDYINQDNGKLEWNAYYVTERKASQKNFAQHEYDVLMRTYGAKLLTEAGIYIHGDVEGALVSEYITVTCGPNEIGYGLAVELCKFIWNDYEFQMVDYVSDARSHILEWRLEFWKKEVK